MTQFTASVSERVSAFGGAPTDLWNQGNWNAFKWGEGTNQAPFFLFTVVAVSAPQTAVVGLAITTPQAEAEAAVAAVGGSVVLPFADTLSVAGAVPTVNLLDESGFYHVFPEPSTNGELRANPTWTAGSNTTPSWSTTTASQPTWSES
jgi:hypothetical protein